MIAAIIQARMGSTRLPGKSLRDIGGQPMLYHVVERVRRSEMLDQIIVATSEAEADRQIEVFCRERDLPCHRGSEEDVLDRYYHAAEEVQADIIVRITGDCPLIDPDVIDEVLHIHQRSDCDYASNTIERTYPDGLDTEAFSFLALEKAWREATLKSEREHVTPYIWKNDDLFNLCQVTQDEDHSSLRWTVDEPEDLDFVRCVYQHLYQPGHVFGMDDVLALLDEQPGLADVNRSIPLNEGYQRSIEGDEQVK